MSRCWAALAPLAVEQRRGAGRGWRARRAGPLTPLEARGRIGFGACRRLGQKWPPVLGGGAWRGPALWRISGHRPTPVPACVSVGIRVCLCVSALQARRLPVHPCSCAHTFCVCVSLRPFQAVNVCVLHACLRNLSCFCVLFLHVFVCVLVSVSQRRCLRLCMRLGPCSVSGRFFSTSVSPSYLCASVCLRAPELFCVAQGFCVCGFVFCVFLGAFVCLYPGAWVCGRRVFFTHPSSAQFLPSVGNLRP